MCTGAEPLVLGAGEAGLAEAMGLGVGDFIGSGAPEILGMGAGAGLGMGATDMSLGTAGAGNYLASLGGEGTLLGSEFTSNLAPFTQGATDVASITSKAVPGLENNIGDLGSFDGIPPQAPEPIPGLSQGRNFRILSDPELANVMKDVNPNFINSLAPDSSISQNFQNGNFRTTIPAEGSSFLSGMENVANTEGAGVAGAAGGTYGATDSPFSLSNLMSNPMGAVKSAYDTVSKNPIPSMYAAGSLYDMYAKNKMAEAQKGMYNQNRADIMNTYAPGSPEYNLLAQQMARKDAVSGRNSQYGARANDLAATIAKLRMGALGNLQQGQNALGNQALGNQYGMFNTPLALAAYSAR